MKRLKKGMLALCVLCGAICLHPQTVQAKQLTESKSCSVDLDGNGKKETVRYTGKATGEYNGYQVSISVDGKKLASLSDRNAIYAAVSLVDIDSNDTYKELYVHFTSESGCFEQGCGYRYEAGKLKRVFTLSGKDASSFRLSIMEKQPGDGMVYFETEYADPYTMQGYVKEAYKISSGKLKSAKKSVMSTTGEWKKKPYKATASLKAYRSIGAKSAAFTLSSGDTFNIYKIKFKKAGKPQSGIAYIYVRTADGKKGWVKNPQKSYCLGYSEYDKSWNEYAYLWG